MLKTYLLLFIRGLRKNKTYSAISIIGTALGTGVFLLIMLYVQFERSYDTYHPDYEQIYRVNAKQNGNEYMGLDTYAVLPAPLATQMRLNYPDDATFVRLNRVYANPFAARVGERQFFDAKNVYMADPEVVDLFGFEFVQGSAVSATADERTVFLSESQAQTYFGRTDVLGENLSVRISHSQEFLDLMVGGVYRDMPMNSHLRMGMVINFEFAVKNIQPGDLEGWNNSNYLTYVKLRPGVSTEAVEAHMAEIRKTHANDPREGESEPRTQYHLEPIAQTHFTRINFDVGQPNDARLLTVLGFIAVLIFLVANINYVNLSTARALSRAKEVGVRKVSGATRRDLVFQFIGESVGINLIGLVLALVGVWMFLPYYEQFTGRAVNISDLSTPILIGLALMPLVIGALAGCYPAFVLSAYNPVTVLKGSFRTSKSGTRLRNSLVVVQFAVSAVLIICTVVAGRQMQMMLEKDPGYSRDQILVVHATDQRITQQKDMVKNELLSVPGVQAVTFTSHLPSNIDQQQGRRWTNDHGTVDVRFYTLYTDYDYDEVFGLKLIEGRHLSPDIPTDRKAYLLNETGVQYLRNLGFTDVLDFPIIEGGDTVKVVGVLADFNFQSMHHPVTPMRIGIQNFPWARYVSLKVDASQMASILPQVERIVKAVSPDYPYRYEFFDEVYAAAYVNEARLSTLVQWFALVTIAIACMGLYGLAMLSILARTKEIGIRKVLGASEGSIVGLITGHFVKYVALAFVLAAPLGYYLATTWLQSFAFAVPVDVSVFGISMALLLGIAALTVGLKSLRAAQANPISALRSE